VVERLLGNIYSPEVEPPLVSGCEGGKALAERAKYTRPGEEVSPTLEKK
jgi:hypothetical protein